MKNSYLYLVIIPFALWALSEIFIFRPDFFFVAVALGLLVIVFGVRTMMRRRSSRYWPLLAIAPSVFYLSFSLYSTLLLSRFWVQIIFLLIVWFIFFYLKDIYFYFSFGAPEREAKLRRLILSGSFLSIFALAASMYALPNFLNWPSSLLLLAFVGLAAVCFRQFFTLPQRMSLEDEIFWGLDVLILAEIAAVLFFWPLNHRILGFVVALIFYFLVLVEQWRKEKRLTGARLKWPLILGLSMLIVILLSARWL